MTDFPFAVMPALSMNRARVALQAHWQRLPVFERRAVAAGGLVSLGMLVALALTCQASVLKGERLRADQRQAAALAQARLQDEAGRNHATGAMVGGAAFKVSIAKPAAAL